MLQNIDNLSNGSDEVLKNALKKLVEESEDIGNMMQSTEKSDISVEDLRTLIRQSSSSLSQPRSQQSTMGQRIELDTYDQGKGYVMIVAQSNFKDLEKRNIDEDVKKIEKLFSQHKVQEFVDLKKDKFEVAIEDAVKELDTGKYQFFGFFSLSHGGEEVNPQSDTSSAESSNSIKAEDDKKQLVLATTFSMNNSYDFIVDTQGEKICYIKDIVHKFHGHGVALDYPVPWARRFSRCCSKTRQDKYISSPTQPARDTKVGFYVSSFI